MTKKCINSLKLIVKISLYHQNGILLKCFILAGTRGGGDATMSASISRAFAVFSWFQEFKHDDDDDDDMMLVPCSRVGVKVT